MVALYYILDTARINSITLSSLNNGVDPRSVPSFKAGRELANALVLAQEMDCPNLFFLKLISSLV